MSGHTQTIRNGQIVRLNILSGQSLAVVAASGTYNASIVQGVGIGVIATAATGPHTYGPYPSGIVISLTASASSEIDFSIAVTPVVSSDTILGVARVPYRLKTRTWLGSRLFGPSGGSFSLIGNTYQMAHTIEQHCDEVRYIYSSLLTTGYVVTKATVTSIADFAHLTTGLATMNAGVWADLTFTQPRTSVIATAGAGGPAGPINWTARGGNPRRPASGTATLTAGAITAVTIVDAGDGYATGDLVTCHFTDAFTTAPSVSLPITTGADCLVGPRTSSAIPTYTASDYVKLSSLARTDNAAYTPILVQRSYAANAGAAALELTGIAAIHLSAEKRFLKGTYQAVDGVTTKTNFTRSTNDQYFMGIGFQYRARSPVMSVAAAGDSITYGTGGDSLHPWGVYAVYGTTMGGDGASAAYTTPVEFCNAGIGGQTAPQYLARVEGLLKLLTPDVLVFSPYSPNDGVTASSKGIVSNAISLSQQYDALPVLWTGIPNSANTAVDATRLTYNTYIKALPVAVVDANAVMTNGATPERMLTGYTADDLHPLLLGQQSMSVPFKQGPDRSRPPHARRNPRPRHRRQSGAVEHEGDGADLIGKAEVADTPIVRIRCPAR